MLNRFSAPPDSTHPRSLLLTTWIVAGNSTLKSRDRRKFYEGNVNKGVGEGYGTLTGVVKPPGASCSRDSLLLSEA